MRRIIFLVISLSPLLIHAETNCELRNVRPHAPIQYAGGPYSLIVSAGPLAEKAQVYCNNTSYQLCRGAAGYGCYDSVKCQSAFMVISKHSLILKICNS